MELNNWNTTTDHLASAITTRSKIVVQETPTDCRVSSISKQIQSQWFLLLAQLTKPLLYQFGMNRLTRIHRVILPNSVPQTCRHEIKQSTNSSQLSRHTHFCNACINEHGDALPQFSNSFLLMTTSVDTKSARWKMNMNKTRMACEKGIK